MGTDAPEPGPHLRPARLRQRVLGFLLLAALAFGVQRSRVLKGTIVSSDSARARRWYDDRAAGKLATAPSQRRFLTLCAVASSDELRFIDGASTRATGSD